MTVAETTSIDQAALQENGRLLLAMTEVRSYDGDNQLQLVEDFRLKLNAYVYAIRSGQLADSGSDGNAPAGFDIVLFAPQEPPAELQEMIRIAAEALSNEACTVSWRLLDRLREAAAAGSAPPSELSVEQLTVALAKALVPALPAGWTHAQYRPAIIVGRSQDQLAVSLSNGNDRMVDPPIAARELVPWLKHKMYEPRRGTWLSAVITLVSDGKLMPEYNYDDEPNWSRPLPEQCWAEELKTYPRDAQHLPDWWAAKLGD